MGMGPSPLTGTRPQADSEGVTCDTAPVFEELCPEDCLELLKNEPVGHVALSTRALPVVLPVSFAVLDGDIVWKVGKGTQPSDSSVVAFEADHCEPDRTQRWSVMVQGLAHVMTDAEVTRAKQLCLESWTVEGTADSYICLVPEIVTGTRIRNTALN